MIRGGAGRVGGDGAACLCHIHEIKIPTPCSYNENKILNTFYLLLMSQANKKKSEGLF
jgi:hypothetical protein